MIPHAEARELDDIVAYAHRLWSEIVRDRMGAERKSPVHYDKINEVLVREEGTIRGHLLRMAYMDASSCHLPAPGEEFQAASERFRSALNDERRHLVPPPAVPERDQSTVCMHDVAYTDPCAACGP